MGASTDIGEAIGTSTVVREAYELVVAKHSDQTQKVNGRPYIEHPTAVATNVSRAGFDPETVAAALLHDIVEDSDVSLEQIRDSFGERVAALVEAMTDEAEVEPYERRKALHRERVLAAGPEAAAIFAADKLENVRALRGAYREVGEEVAQRYSQPLDTKVQVWVADAEMAARYAAALPYVESLEAEVEGLRVDRLKSRSR